MVFLSIDHINNDGAEHRKLLKTLPGASFYHKMKKLGYPPILQVLCMNCQFGKRYGAICPHQLQAQQSQTALSTSTTVTQGL